MLRTISDLLPQLLSYGGVASPVAVRARTQLLKELDPGSNPAERGWSHLWCLRAGHADGHVSTDVKKRKHLARVSSLPFGTRNLDARVERGVGVGQTAGD